MKFDSNTAILTVNFLLYFLWFWRNFKKYKRITPHNFMLLWISFIAFMAVIIYGNGLFSNWYMAGSRDLPTIDPIGLLLVFLSFIILLFPLKKLENIGIQEVIIPKHFKFFEMFSIIFFLACCILLIPYSLQAMAMDAVDIYVNKRVDNEDLLPKYMLLLTTFASLLFYFFVPYCFYQIRDKISFKYMFFIVLLFLFSIQRGVIAASRGSLFLSLATFAFTYLLFYRYYSKKVQTIARHYFIVLIIVCTTIGIGITISRFSDARQIDPLESIEVYFGETFNNFCFRVWGDPNIKHTHGEALFPGIYSLITGNQEISFDSRQDNVEYIRFKANTAVMNNFSTMYGQLYVEFGWFFPFVFIALLSFFIYRYFKKDVLNFYQFPVLIYLFQFFYFYSPFSNMFREVNFKHFFYVIIMSVFIKILFKTQNNDKILDRNTGI